MVQKVQDSRTRMKQNKDKSKKECSKKESSKKENYKSKLKKSLMATWVEFDKKADSDKDEEEANLGQLTTTTSNVESESNYDDGDKELLKLLNQVRVRDIKEILKKSFQNKHHCPMSSDFKNLLT